MHDASSQLLLPIESRIVKSVKAPYSLILFRKTCQTMLLHLLRDVLSARWSNWRICKSNGGFRSP